MMKDATTIYCNDWSNGNSLSFYFVSNALLILLGPGLYSFDWHPASIMSGGFPAEVLLSK